MPLYLKEAGNLVGAPLGSMSHDEIAAVHKNSAAYTTGYVYDEPQYQSLCLDVAAQIQQATHGTSRGLFFPECSNKNLLSYDCLVKTINFIMGFPLFTLREQGVRLIMKNSHITMEEADIVKTKGGIPMDCMQDFAVDDHCAYSFTKLASFNYLEMMRKSSDKDYCPADEVLAYIHDQMLTRELHTKLLVILKGNVLDEFQHALCFLRKDFLYNKGRLNQLLLLDSKNSGPCVYPRFHRELQLHFNDEDRVNAKEDLLNKVYYAADIYTLSMRHVTGPEKRRIENHMKWVLTGEDEHW